MTSEQVQQREWHLRSYQCPQIQLELELHLDPLFPGINKVKARWPQSLVCSSTLSIKPPVAIVVFQTQLSLEINMLLLSCITFLHFDSFLSLGGPEPSISQRLLNTLQLKQPTAHSCLLGFAFCLPALFLTFPLPECTLFSPSSKCSGGCPGDVRQLKIISVLMHHSLSRTL